MSKHFTYILVSGILSFFDRIFFDTDIPVWADVIKFVIFLTVFKVVDRSFKNKS